MKKMMTGFFVLSSVIAMIGASAPSTAKALECDGNECLGDGDDGGGGGGGGVYCPPGGIYTCYLRPTGAWICGYQSC